MGKNYMEREIAKVPAEKRAEKRLELDFAELLIGPTCGSEARRLAASLLRTTPAEDLAKALVEAGTRYLAECRRQSADALEELIGSIEGEDD